MPYITIEKYVLIGKETWVIPMSYILFWVMAYIYQSSTNFTLKIRAFYCMYNIIQVNKKFKVVASREQGEWVGRLPFSLQTFCITF